MHESGRIGKQFKEKTSSEEGECALRPRNVAYIGNEKAGAKRPLDRIHPLFLKFRSRSSPARPDTAVLWERIPPLGDVRRKSPAAPTIRSRIAVIAVADTTTENHAEDTPEHRSNTATRAWI